MYGQLGGTAQEQLAQLFAQQQAERQRAEELYRQRVGMVGTELPYYEQAYGWRSPEEIAQAERENQEYLAQLQARLGLEQEQALKAAGLGSYYVEPKTTSGGGGGGGTDLDKLLSPSEAKTLGVPYGTTKGEAIAMVQQPTKTASVWRNIITGQTMTSATSPGPNWVEVGSVFGGSETTGGIEDLLKKYGL